MWGEPTSHRFDPVSTKSGGVAEYCWCCVRVHLPFTGGSAGFERRDLRRRIPVLLVHGDEHVYEVEPAYAGVSNLTRLETYGDTATNWLRVTADPRTTTVFSWEPRRL